MRGAATRGAGRKQTAGFLLTRLMRGAAITATIQRSDEVSSNKSHPWMEDAWFETESAAIEWLEFKCGKEQA